MPAALTRRPFPWRYGILVPNHICATRGTRWRNPRSRQSPANWPFGTQGPSTHAASRWGNRVSGSNTNYVVLGMLLEAATGHPWARLVHERVIEPLGLRHTFTPGTSPYVPQPTATACTWFPGADRPTDTTLATGGGADGGIISTPRDLATFLRALMSGRLLRPAQLAAMKRTVPAPDWIPAPGVRYGLGIAWRPVAGSRDGVWFHGGTHLGVVSESGVTPDGSRAVAAAVFTLRTDEEGRKAQALAALRLVDNALTA
ncbi:serine hydrolase domain-containing protein [Streptomyces sp. NPDC049577]|uniref:serine hydrolase domain-containing protein n=1 Tax=Streptomyces sp. NPDC049577 TaxID=3155153 RepID=UPI003419A814